jgi:hypothetical protein
MLHRLLIISITSTTQNLPKALSKLLAVNESTEILRYDYCFIIVVSAYLRDVL